MTRFKDTDYAYATARIRAIETKLLDKSRMDRMIDSHTPQEAIKVLVESGYGMQSGELENVYEYERLLTEEMQKTYELLLELSPDSIVFRMFQQKNDFLNAKTILKAEFLGVEPEQLLETGTIDSVSMKMFIKERDYKELTEIMQKALEETVETFGRTSDPQVIDLILDHASQEQMMDMVSNIENEYILELIRIMTDMTNIRTFVRVKTLNRSWDFLRKVLLPGGTISEKDFFEYIDKTQDAFFDSMRFSRYGDVTEKGYSDYKTTNTMTQLEKLFDDYLLEYAKNAKIIAMGIEPLVGYLIAKETELKNVRIIMTGKINKISSERIRERLRESYV